MCLRENEKERERREMSVTRTASMVSFLCFYILNAFDCSALGDVLGGFGDGFFPGFKFYGMLALWP